jgi:hypothetical protein
MRVCRAVLACATSFLALLLLLLLLLTRAPRAGAAVVELIPFKDNTLYQDSLGMLSNGAGDHLFIGTTNEGLLRRGLIAFDIAGNIPAGATINSASLRLTVTQVNTGPSSVLVHRMLSNWGEGTSHATGNEGRGILATPGDATWTFSFYDTVEWINDGGDFETQESAASRLFGFGDVTCSSADLIADVQYWVDHPAKNFGWILRGDEGSLQTAYRFDSRSVSSEETRPLLTIEYTAVPEPAGGIVGAAVVMLWIIKFRRPEVR